MAKQPKYKLSYIGSASTDAKAVPAKLRSPIADAISRLAYEGCQAAGYALSGPHPWPGLCSVHVEDWRILVTFPAADEVTVVKIARHAADSDPYAEVAEELGIPASTTPRTKPPCCQPDGEAPVDETIAARIEDAYARLTRKDRRRRR